MAKTQEKIQEPMKPDVARTPEQLALHQKVMAQDDSWRTGITEESTIEYFKTMVDPLAFPEAVRKLEDRKVYKFRWIDKRNLPNALSRPVPMRWWIVNSTQPDSTLAPLIDSLSGAIEMNNCVLCFKRWDHYVSDRKIVEARSEASARGADLKEFAANKSDERVSITAGNKSFTKADDVVVGAEIGADATKVEMEQDFEGISNLVDTGPDE
jgi:hypothetical protein